MIGNPIGPDPYICIIGESSHIEDDRIQQITREYQLLNFSSRLNAEASLALSPLAPDPDGAYTNLLRRDIRVQLAGTDYSTGDDFYRGTVSWQRWNKKVVDRETISGAIAGSPQRLKYTRKNKGNYGINGAAGPDLGGAVNVTQNGVEGVDIEFPTFSFAINRLYDKGTITLALMNSLKAFVHKPNRHQWRVFQPWEVKIVGINFDDSGHDFDVINWVFAVSETVNNIVIPVSADGTDKITIPTKRGWEYVHVREVNTAPDDEPDKWVVDSAHVEEMTADADLNLVI